MYSKRLSLNFLLFMAVFLCAAAAGAQDDASDWYYSKPVSSITFEGLKNVKESELEGITGSFIGKPFTDDMFSDLIDRIYALDFFEDITPVAKHDPKDPDRINLVFTVVERPVIAEIKFSGNHQIRNGELRDTVAIKVNDVYVNSKVLIDERALRDLYLNKGFMDVFVSTKIEDSDKGKIVTFVINEGRKTIISEINFSGNNVISSKVLKKQVSLKEKGLINAGAFQESDLEKDKQSLVTYYKDRGYIDASVVDVMRKVTVNKEKNRDELTLTFVIQEGSQYTFGGVTFVGNKIFSTDELRPLISLQKGDVFNETKFHQGVMAVADKYYENGYTSNGFVPKETQNADAKTVSYLFTITEKPRSHVENIIIKGNTRTQEKVIRREIPIETGDIFSKTKLTTGLRNLYNLQYFSAVVPDIVPGSEDNLVNLVISVEEQNTTSIEFGMTFSGVTNPDDLPFALFVKWQDSNFRGTGRSISADTTISDSEQSISFGYSQNWLFDMPISWSENLSFTHSDESCLRDKWLSDGTLDNEDYYMDYEHWKVSLTSSIGHRWTPDFAIVRLSGGITNSLINNIYDENLYTPVDTSVSEYANTWKIQNSIWSGFSLDGRDVNYDPSKGWFVSEKVAWYGLTPLETEFFLRTDTKLEGYLTLINLPITEKWNLKAVLAAYSGLSLLFPAVGSSVGNSSQLYIDGMFNGRGWTDIYDSVRGKAMWSNNIELRVPVVPGVIAMDGFFDAAVIKDEPEQIFRDLNIQDFYFSVGPGLRFSIPQFPLRLLLANTFRATDSGIKWYNKWEFVLSFNLVNK
jgi:outer membrane protein insertion porin family